MSFGKDLSLEFKKLANGGHYGEVELFTKLQDALINLRSSKYGYEIDLIHGSRSQVQFVNNSTWVTGIAPGSTQQCELADMMFIVFSDAKKQIRLMYMQNKNGDTSSWSFSADLVQLHLLKDRREITSPALPACVFNDRRILADALLPSVASYGVFYKHNNDTEMAYYPASNLTPLHSTGIMNARVTRFNRPLFRNLRTISGYEESQGEEFLWDFGDRLIDMQIGTPILPGTAAYSELVRCLKDHSQSFRDTELYRQIMGDNPIEDDKQFRGDGLPFVCIINADEAAKVSQ